MYILVNETDNLVRTCSSQTAASALLSYLRGQPGGQGWRMLNTAQEQPAEHMLMPVI